MLLPLYHNHPSFSSKSLDHFLSPSPKPLFSLQNPRSPKSLPFTARSASPDTETVTKTAIQRIAEKLRNLGYVEELPQPQLRPNIGPGTPGEIFIPAPHQLPKHRVGHTIDNSWSSPESPVPDPGSGVAVTRFHELRAEELRKRRKEKTEAPPTVAELTLPAEELRRLQSVGIRLRKKLKIGKAGITEGIVNGIHERWRRSELVKIKCEDLCRINMKRTHEMLEV